MKQAMPENGRKMVFFDIDGTIMDIQTHRIPESAVRAIRALRRNGHLAFINSGRTLVSIDRRIKDIGFDGYVCGCGSRIYSQGEELFAIHVPRQRCLEILRALRECCIAAFCESWDAVYFDAASPVKSAELEKTKAEFRQLGIPMKPFPLDASSKSATFDKFFCLTTKESDVARLTDFVKADFYGTPQGPGHLEFVKKGHSKAEGIRLLQKELGISLQNCYAIGDSENDLPMLKAVPNSIAMGCCSPEILPFCVHQTAAVMDDGIEKALSHFGLI